MKNAGYIADHEDRAVDVLTEKRSAQPLTEDITRALTRPVQTVEDVAFDLGAVLKIGGATDVWLDRLGAIVGEPRLGLGDAQYRGFIQARLQINRSQGERERLIRIAQLMTGANFIQITSAYPAGYTMLLVTPTFLTPELQARVRDRMERATAMGVGVDLVNGVGTKDTVFRHDQSTQPHSSDVTGADGQPRSF